VTETAALFAKGLKEWRKRAKLSQEELADAIKTHKGQIGRYERGGGVTLDTVGRVIKALGIPGDTLEAQLAKFFIGSHEEAGNERELPSPLVSPHAETRDGANWWYEVQRRGRALHLEASAIPGTTEGEALRRAIACLHAVVM